MGIGNFSAKPHYKPPPSGIFPAFDTFGYCRGITASGPPPSWRPHPPRQAGPEQLLAG